MTSAYASRFQLVFSAVDHRRLIAGHEVVVHCHHYNARIQRTIENSTAIDGKHIFVSSAEAVFVELLRSVMQPADLNPERWQVAGDLYAHLGYGQLDLTKVDQGSVTASESHFVEGWAAGFPSYGKPVCSLTQGYIQAAFHVILGKLVQVQEVVCIAQGADRCEFSVDFLRSAPLAQFSKLQGQIQIAAGKGSLHSPNVDEEKIVSALVEMPIQGNADGLIPAFNVYLANMPADFYNLVCIRFVEEMAKADLESVARRQLVHDAETCAMNTFRGIMASPEWDALVRPMLHETEDALFGIIAVSNALGWGNWYVMEHVEGESLKLRSDNGYESSGFLELRTPQAEPVCLMLTGVAAGIMALIYGEGSIRERFGQYISQEVSCRCGGSSACIFDVRENR